MSLHSIALAVVIFAHAASAQPCPGDCDGNGVVGIAELVSAVSISLETAPLDQCPSADGDGNGRVTVDEIVAAVGAALHGCGAQTHAFVVTTNFQAGSFATVSLDDAHVVSPSTSRRRIYGDATARVYGGLVYVINRLFADNIQLLDPAQDFATRFQCSTGNDTNPHDIAIVDDTKAYVTLFERAQLLIVNPFPRADCSDFIRGAIDLSSAADADGIPDMDLTAVAGDHLYVSLQRLDINSTLRLPATNGALAVIDIATDTLIDTIELTGENPFASTRGLTVRDGAIYVAESGLFGVSDGGIERVDLASGQAQGFFVTEDDLGGDVTDFVLVSDRLAYAIVSHTDFGTALISFNPATAERGQTLLQVDTFTLFDIELDDRGELFVADRDRNHDGIRIYRAADGEQATTQPLDLGLAPFNINFLP